MRPSVYSGTSNLICDEILNDRIEFGIFFTLPKFAGFVSVELLEIPFHLVIATELLKSASPKNNFIISREVDYPKARPFPVLEMLHRQKIQVEVGISSNNLDAQKEMVKQGLGVALLPGFMVNSSLQKGTLSLVPPRKEFSYSLKLVHRRGKPLSKNARAFVEVFKDFAQRMTAF